MKRRDFLSGATFLATSAWAGRSLGKPCPPSTFVASGGTTAVTPCSAGTVPSWFRSLEPNRWLSVAAGPKGSRSPQSGDRLAEVVPAGPYFGNYGPRYLTAGWNGACVDTDNMEMIVALNGGHAAWQYNDAYALSLASELPAWRRIVDSTPEVDPSTGRHYYDAVNHESGDAVPDGFIDRVLDPSGATYARPFVVPGWLNDGPQPQIAASDRAPDLGKILRRPRTLHTCSHYHYSNGRVWYPIMNAWNQGSGLTSLVKLALDVDGLRQNPALKAWRYGDLGPWRYLGVISEQTGGDTADFGFGVAALDASTGKIWYAGQKTSTYWSMDTRGASAGQHRFYSDAPRTKKLSSSAGSICHGIRLASGETTSLFVMLEVGTYRVWVLDTSKAGSGDAWTVIEPANAEKFEWAAELKKVEPSFTGYTAAYGMVYETNSSSLLAYNCDQLPNRSTLRRLSIPSHADGTYNPQGNWTWSEILMAGDPPSPNNPGAGNIGGGGGSYTRFNIIPDFGGTGESLLIHLSHFDQATSVCKFVAGA